MVLSFLNYNNLKIFKMLEISSYIPFHLEFYLERNDNNINQN